MSKKELIDIKSNGFIEKVTPKMPGDHIYFFECPNCGSIHLRHAGYVKTLAPFIRPGDEKQVDAQNAYVMVCVKCRFCYAWINEQVYDITDKIDLEAWEKMEAELHKATGPGGEC